MGLLLLVGAERSVVLTVLLVLALGLTLWETREQQLENKKAIWWMLVVLLIHVPGYLMLRVWGVYQKRERVS